MSTHIDQHYEAELAKLKEQVLKMGGLVETMIAQAMKAMVERHTELARAVIEQEKEVNLLEVGIDDRCFEMLALHQPAASDLRFIVIGLRVSKDLERMGDLAVNICQLAMDLNKEPQLKPYIDLPKMAAKTQEMVKGALDSFVRRDADQAQHVCEVDDEVDRYKHDIFKELVELMEKDPQAVSRGTRLILVSRHLERIADHATNIAEEVIFMVQGRDIRHGGRKKK